MTGRIPTRGTLFPVGSVDHPDYARYASSATVAMTRARLGGWTPPRDPVRAHADAVAIVGGARAHAAAGGDFAGYDYRPSAPADAPRDLADARRYAPSSRPGAPSASTIGDRAASSPSPGPATTPVLDRRDVVTHTTPLPRDELTQLLRGAAVPTGDVRGVRTDTIVRRVARVEKIGDGTFVATDARGHITLFDVVTRPSADVVPTRPGRIAARDAPPDVVRSWVIPRDRALAMFHEAGLLPSSAAGLRQELEVRQIRVVAFPGDVYWATIELGRFEVHTAIARVPAWSGRAPLAIALDGERAPAHDAPATALPRGAAGAVHAALRRLPALAARTATARTATPALAALDDGLGALTSRSRPHGVYTRATPDAPRASAGSSAHTSASEGSSAHASAGSSASAESSAHTSASAESSTRASARSSASAGSSTRASARSSASASDAGSSPHAGSSARAGSSSRAGSSARAGSRRRAGSSAGSSAHASAGTRGPAPTRSPDERTSAASRGVSASGSPDAAHAEGALVAASLDDAARAGLDVGALLATHALDAGAGRAIALDHLAKAPEATRATARAALRLRVLDDDGAVRARAHAALDLLEPPSGAALDELRVGVTHAEADERARAAHRLRGLMREADRAAELSESIPMLRALGLRTPDASLAALDVESLRPAFRALADDAHPAVRREAELGLAILGPEPRGLAAELASLAERFGHADERASHRAAARELRRVRSLFTGER